MSKKLDIYRPADKSIVDAVVLRVRATLHALSETGDVLIDERTRHAMNEALEEQKAGFHEYDIDVKLDASGERPLVKIVVGNEEICSLGC